eukprot:3027001-Prymnesium_polylepis.2
MRACVHQSHAAPTADARGTAPPAKVHADCMAALEPVCGPACAVPKKVPRDEFYELTRDAYAIVQTGERRPYGCFILNVGMLGPDGRDF